MSRFYISPEEFQKDEVCITGEDFRHLSKVLRLVPDDIIELCDGNGHEARGKIISVDKEKAVAKLTDRQESPGENKRVHAVLFQGLPKQGKMDLIVQKATELGVEKVVPFFAKRSIPKPSKSDSKKTLRLQRIAYEASKQCGRGKIPVVSPPVSFSGLPEELKTFDHIILLYEKEDVLSLKNVLTTIEKTFTNPVNIAVVIGPEGGFDSKEVEVLTEAGAVSTSLGKRILRTETAGPAALAQINYALEEK